MNKWQDRFSPTPQAPTDVLIDRSTLRRLRGTGKPLNKDAMIRLGVPADEYPRTAWRRLITNTWVPIEDYNAAIAIAEGF